MTGDELVELGHRVGVGPEIESSLLARLQRQQAQLIEPDGGRPAPRLAGQVAERRALPQRKGHAQGGECVRRRREPGGPDGPLEAIRVEHRAVAGEHVPAGVGGHIPAAERRAQPRHVRQHGAAGPGRRLVIAPDSVDDPVDADHPALPEEQHGEQAALARSAEHDLAAAVERTNGAEHAELHRHPLPTPVDEGPA